MKLKKLNIIPGKVLINIRTLKVCRCDVYINSLYEQDWVYINKNDIESFIEEHKTKQETNSVETT